MHENLVNEYEIYGKINIQHEYLVRKFESRENLG